MRKLYKIFLFCSLATIHCSLAFAQQHKTDSLFTVLKTEKEDTSRIKTIMVLSGELFTGFKYKQSDSVAKAGLALALKLNFNKGILRLYTQLGNVAWSQGNYNAAIDNYRLVIHYDTNNPVKKATAGAYLDIGIMYVYIGKYPDALNNLLKCAEINDAIGNKQGVRDAYENMAVLYTNQNNIDAALQQELKCLEIDKGISKKNMGLDYVQIAELLEQKRNYREALKNAQPGLEMNLEAKNDDGIMKAYSRLGNIYLDLHNDSAALRYFNQGMQVALSINDKRFITTAYENIAGVKFDQGDYNQSNVSLYKGLAVCREIGNNFEMVNLRLAIAHNLIALKKFENARAVADSALKGAVAIKEKERAETAYTILVSIDSGTGNYNGAIKSFKIAQVYKDSLTNEESTKRQLGAQMQYEFDKQQLAEKSEQEKRELAAVSEKRKQVILRNFFIVGFALTLALGFFVFRGYMQKQKANIIITKQKEEMERLSIVASQTENLVLIMSADGTVEWANESFRRVNGIEIEELKKQKGNTIYEISNNPSIKGIIDSAVRGKKSVVYESVNTNKQGVRQWESSTLTPIFGSDGKLQRLIIVDTDITQRKSAEEIIQAKNKDILDSITYAKRLQEAILPPLNVIKNHFPESFVLYKPKDIVAGDFYWMEKSGDNVFIAACDCTGHGVPGAMVSVVCSNALNRALNEFKITETGKLLDKTRELVLETYGKSEGDIKDGMDISLASLNLSKEGIQLQWSGAYNSLWYMQNGEMKEIPGDKQPIGKTDNPKSFTTHTLSLPIAIGTHSTLYLFTDGYADQFGGPKGKKFKYKQLQETLSVISSQPMQEQKRILEETFNSWKGELEQVDDILIIGIRV